MLRIRTINEAFDYIKKVDPESSLTKNALRKLVITGKIPSTKSGCKYLINLDILENYLNGN